MPRDPIVDALRGLTMFEMENTETSTHWLFDHALYDEKTMTYADTIFPCFSFISGMTVPVGRKVPLKRGFSLIGLGLVFTGIPTVLKGQKYRPFGVLQRHGLASVILNNLAPTWLKQSPTYPLVMSGLWMLLSVVFADNRSDPFEKEETTAQLKFDRLLFEGRTYRPSFDPEGFLGSIMTSVTIWSGYYFAQLKLSDLQTFCVGTGQFLGGKVLSTVFPKFLPVSKPLWTPSFVLMSNGVSMLRYLALRSAYPYLPQALQSALGVVGRNSLEIYFIGRFLMILCDQTPFSLEQSLWESTQSFLKRFMPQALATLGMTIAYDVLLVSLAMLCEKYNFHIRLF